MGGGTYTGHRGGIEQRQYAQGAARPHGQADDVPDGRFARGHGRRHHPACTGSGTCRAGQTDRTLNAVAFERVIAELHARMRGLAQAAADRHAVFEGALLLRRRRTRASSAGPRCSRTCATDRWAPNQVLVAVVTARRGQRRAADGRGGSADPDRDARATCRCSSVLYSVNVFLAFSLSLLGLTRHWWAVMRDVRGVGVAAACWRLSRVRSPAASCSRDARGAAVDNGRLAALGDHGRSSRYFGSLVIGVTTIAYARSARALEQRLQWPYQGAVESAAAGATVTRADRACCS